MGIEPTNKGFADPCLTTWLRRRWLGRKSPAAACNASISDRRSRSERAMGFEPTTFCLASRRSTTELHPHFAQEGYRDP